MLTTFVWQSTHPVATKNCPMELFTRFLIHLFATKSFSNPSDTEIDPVAFATGLDYFRLKGSMCSTPRTCVSPGFTALIFSTEAIGYCSPILIKPIN